METNKEKMLKGDLYLATDSQLENEATRCQDLILEYNTTSHHHLNKRFDLLNQLLGACGENIVMIPPIHFDYGINTHIGNNFFSNRDTIILDVAHVTIGNNVMFGPRCGLYTASHPLDASIRIEGYELGLPINIGDDVWLGGNVTVNPGVSIGSRTVIGSGSVVINDIPSDVIAAGNPCSVIRPITDHDYTIWHAKKQKYLDTIRR